MLEIQFISIHVSSGNNTTRYAAEPSQLKQKSKSREMRLTHVTLRRRPVLCCLHKFKIRDGPLNDMIQMPYSILGALAAFHSTRCRLLFSHDNA